MTATYTEVYSDWVFHPYYELVWEWVEGYWVEEYVWVDLVWVDDYIVLYNHATGEMGTFIYYLAYEYMAQSWTTEPFRQVTLYDPNTGYSVTVYEHEAEAYYNMGWTTENYTVTIYRLLDGYSMEVYLSELPNYIANGEWQTTPPEVCGVIMYNPVDGSMEIVPPGMESNYPGWVTGDTLITVYSTIDGQSLTVYASQLAYVLAYGTWTTNYIPQNISQGSVILYNYNTGNIGVFPVSIAQEYLSRNEGWSEAPFEIVKLYNIYTGTTIAALNWQIPSYLSSGSWSQTPITAQPPQGTVAVREYLKSKYNLYDGNIDFDGTHVTVCGKALEIEGLIVEPGITYASPGKIDEAFNYAFPDGVNNIIKRYNLMKLKEMYPEKFGYFNIFIYDNSWDPYLLNNYMADFKYAFNIDDSATMDELTDKLQDAVDGKLVFVRDYLKKNF